MRALIAMSGGVDSSVAAVLMKNAGFECVGVTMKLHGELPSEEQSCCTESDIEDARRVCEKLGMEYHLYNFTGDFEKEVISRFVAAYENGITPNPCIDCNRYMKFDKLFAPAKELDCDFIVTGHYARVEFNEKSGRWLLKKSVNPQKDQSYVLYSLTQERLAHIRFPLGEYADKEQVRSIAVELDLVNADKKDSQDICFVPDGDYAGFIRSFTGKEYPSGDFVGLDGSVYGRHKGIICYTIGQRKGFGLSFPQPMYVVAKDLEKNTVTLAPESELYRTELTAHDFNWISLETPPREPIRVTAKTRYRAKEAPAFVYADEDGTVHVQFDEPQRAITSGQAVVLYDGDVVVGGGIIS